PSLHPGRCPGLSYAVPSGLTKQTATGTASVVHAVDWDGDGRLDLLVGDFATQKPDRPEPSEKEKAEHAKMRKELDQVMGRYLALAQKLYFGGPNRVKDKDERAELEKEFPEVSKKMSELRQKLPPEYE